MKFSPWEKHFVLMAIHLLWNQFDSEATNPHNDEIGDLIAKLEKVMES